MNKKSQNRNVIVVVSIIALIVVLGIVSLLYVKAEQEKNHLSAQLELGNRYMSELNYEQAIATYEGILQIDPKCEEAYIAMAEVYIAMGDFEKAIEILQQGVDATGSDLIEGKMEEVCKEREKTSALTEDSKDDTISEESEIVFIPWADAGLQDHPMDWQDQNLEAAMREVTGISDRDIMLSDVWELTVISLAGLGLHGKGVENINALGELKNMQELYLGWNPITNIDILCKLKNLKYLSIYDNPIEEIKVLGELSQLEGIAIGYCNIADFEVLGKLQNVQYLSLSLVSPHNFDFLKTMSSLRKLCLQCGGIEEHMNVLKELVNLEELDLSGNVIISDISALASLRSLRKLDLGFNMINDINCLEGLTSLNYLDISGNEITDIGILSSMEELEELNLSYTEVSDLSVLSELPKLRYLDIRNTKVTDMSSVQHVLDNGGTVISE